MKIENAFSRHNAVDHVVRAEDCHARPRRGGKDEIP